MNRVLIINNQYNVINKAFCFAADVKYQLIFPGTQYFMAFPGDKNQTSPTRRPSLIRTRLQVTDIVDLSRVSLIS
jgi:hypothetical protein